LADVGNTSKAVDDDIFGSAPTTKPNPPAKSASSSDSVDIFDAPFKTKQAAPPSIFADPSKKTSTASDDIFG